MENIIKYIDLDKLNNIEQSRLKKIVSNEYEKIHRLFHDITNLIVHIKLHEIGGKTKKYSIHIRAEAPTNLISAHASDWDLARCAHKVLDNLTKEIKHRFKITE